MMKTKEAQTKQKRIEDLTRRELDMIYSLMRVGDWSDSEIGRVYKLSVDDVHKVFDNYPQLREACLRNPLPAVLPQAPESELTTKTPRKRRNDARFVTAADRQKAYRARLQESRHTVIEQPSPTANADTPIPAVEETSVTVCEAPVPEIGPEEESLIKRLWPDQETYQREEQRRFEILLAHWDLPVTDITPSKK